LQYGHYDAGGDTQAGLQGVRSLSIFIPLPPEGPR